jgi:hypothetical protein
MYTIHVLFLLVWCFVFSFYPFFSTCFNLLFSSLFAIWGYYPPGPLYSRNPIRERLEFLIIPVQFLWGACFLHFGGRVGGFSFFFTGVSKRFRVWRFPFFL